MSYLVNPFAWEPRAVWISCAIGVALVLERQSLVLQFGPHLTLGFLVAFFSSTETIRYWSYFKHFPGSILTEWQSIFGLRFQCFDTAFLETSHDNILPKRIHWQRHQKKNDCQNFQINKVLFRLLGWRCLVSIVQRPFHFKVLSENNFFLKFWHYFRKICNWEQKVDGTWSHY